MSLFPFWAECLFICFRRNPKIFEELLIGDVLSLTLSNYVRTNPTRIYVHGWTENGQNKLSRNLRDGRLLRFKKKRINRMSN